MIIGNKSKFAIESTIKEAYERLSFRALGCFLIYIDSIKYGVDRPDASLLACSFDEVENRLLTRGLHTAPFSNASIANEIVEAVCKTVYLEEQENEYFFEIPCASFQDIIVTNKLIWVPDGDEAFDDGSHILHFDVENKVRLLGFKRYGNNINNLTDIWLEADEFYAILQLWRDSFKSEWEASLN